MQAEKLPRAEVDGRIAVLCAVVDKYFPGAEVPLIDIAEICDIPYRTIRAINDKGQRKMENMLSREVIEYLL